MAITYTANLALAKPDYGTDPWATHVNNNWDKLDLNYASARFVNTIADLPSTAEGRAYPTVALGYAAKNDGGGGLFVYNSALLATNNGGTIINGWVRQLYGNLPTIWMFGALPGADITTKLQAMLDLGGYYYVPRGTYTISAQLKFKHASSGFIGEGKYTTIFNYTHTAGPVFDNTDHAVTLLGCKLSRMKIVASSMTSTKIIINWFGMKNGRLKDLWLFGPNSASSWGINLEASYGISEATFNEVVNPLIGGVEVGIRLYDGANNNIIRDGRIQLSLAAANGVQLDGSGANRCNANVVDFMEFSAGTANNYGVNVGSGTKGTHITHSRFENMLAGVVVDASAIDVEVPYGSNYFDGCTTDILTNEAIVPSVFAMGLFEGVAAGALDGGPNGGPYNLSLAKNGGTGKYALTISPACRDKYYSDDIRAGGSSLGNLFIKVTAKTASSLTFETRDVAGVLTDADTINISLTR
jgi:hypothetical protein